MQFDWNQEKAQRNLAKHGVSFDEATSVFDDPCGLIILIDIIN
ncbi:MAG: BrnT family toxin [Crocosphaera sp.]